MDTPRSPNRKVTVWYDGECPLCLREIGLMRRLDTRGAIEFIDVHGGKDCPLDPAELLERAYVMFLRYRPRLQRLAGSNVQPDGR